MSDALRAALLRPEKWPTGVPALPIPQTHCASTSEPGNGLPRPEAWPPTECSHRRCPQRSPGSVSCFKQRSDRTDPGTPLLPASDHLPTSFPVATFRTTSVIHGPRDQPTPFSDLNSYCPATTSSQICQNYSTNVEALSATRPPCICGPPTPPSLWAPISMATMWP